MPFDGITIKALAYELNNLCAGRIDKIYQPERDELALSIRTAGGHVKLVISANPRWSRIHISDTRKPNPTSPPSFCMMLRKVLEGGKIRSVEQIDFERIIHITIEAIDDFGDWKKKILICEFMGKHSNIILVNPENNLIIDAIKKYGNDVSSIREVLPGKPYIAPPGQGKVDPTTVSYSDFCSAIWQQTGSLADAVFKAVSGISPFSARQICLHCGLSDLPVEECGEYELTTVFEHIRRLIRACAVGSAQPGVVLKANRPLEFAPYIIEGMSEFQSYPCMNEACDFFYSELLNQARLESIRSNLSRQVRIILDKAYKKKMAQEGDFNSAQDKEKYREWGELITTYAYQLHKGQTEALLTNYYTNEEVLIPLEARYTPIENAQRYYKTYNKSKRAINHLQELIRINQAEINYLESVMVLINKAENQNDLDDVIYELEKGGYLKTHTRRTGKQSVKTEPRHFISSDGFDILVGRNNHQNDRLTLKQSERRDLWLHAKDIPGTHVIVRLPADLKSIDALPDRTLEEAAALAAYFSKASESDKVPVDYTFRSNVRKPSGSKPGMVIYDNYWTIMVNPQSAIIKRFLNSD